MNDAVTAVVPVWNRRELLACLLDRLSVQTYPLAEIVVVDNGSTDGAPELAESRGARVLRMGCNAGFARAVNRGIAESRTPLIAILNNDVEPAPDWLAKLAAAVRDPNTWYATGKVFDAQRRDLLDGTFDALCRGGCPWRIGSGRSDGPLFSIPRVIWSAPATAALFRAELFRKVGAFDEMFESYLEDVEFGLRCAGCGLAGRYVPDALAWHRGSATLGRWHPDTVRRMSRNQVLLLARHYPASLMMRHAWPILVAQLLWAALALRHGCGLAWLRGKLAGIGRFRAARRPAPPCGEAIAPLLRQSECEIFNVQVKTGLDTYWRWYFRLTRGGAK